MKIFETEKNNIPEGATHYQEPDAQHVFAWFKLDGNKLSIKVPLHGEDFDWDECKFSYYRGRITPIPKPEVVEWKNGDECLVENTQGYVVNGEYEKYVGSIGVIRALFETQGGVKMAAVQHCSGDCVCWREEMLSKPESPEEKEQCERLEAAYDLYCDAQHAVDVIVYDSFEQFKADDVQVKFWLAIVDKTNYRKGELYGN